MIRNRPANTMSRQTGKQREGETLEKNYQVKQMVELPSLRDMKPHLRLPPSESVNVRGNLFLNSKFRGYKHACR